jgi:hypothetical protein
VYGATVESNGRRAQLNGGANRNRCGKISDWQHAKRQHQHTEEESNVTSTGLTAVGVIEVFSIRGRQVEDQS